MHPVDRGQQLAAQGVTSLVVGDDSLLVIGQGPTRLHSRHDPLECRIEVAHLDLRGASPRREDRRLVGDVRQIRAGESRCLTRQQLQVDVIRERLVAGMHGENALAAADVGRGDKDLAIEAPGSQQRRVQLLE